MRNLVALFLTTSVLAGCAAQSTAPAPEMAAAAGGAPAADVTAAPKPQYGTYGFDAAGMDATVAPGDNFYQYANGNWAKNTPIPADKSNYGMFTVLEDLSRERTHQIIEEQAKDPNSKIGNAYASFMDQTAIESKGLTPFEPWLNQVRGAKSKSDLAKLYADADQLSIPIPYRMFIGQDRKASDQYALNVLQGGLGMPDRDYYLSKDPKLADTKAKYLQHMTNVLTLAGEKDASARAR